MALLTEGEFRTRWNTDIQSDILSALIADAEADIVNHFGAHTAQTDEAEGRDSLLFLSRPATAITTVTEQVGTVETVLASNDFRLRFRKRALERLTTGTNPRSRWGHFVTVVYTPEDDQVRRKRVCIDLTILALQYRGLASERAGDYSEQGAEYQRERERILAGLAPGIPAFA